MKSRSPDFSNEEPISRKRYRFRPLPFKDPTKKKRVVVLKLSEEVILRIHNYAIKAKKTYSESLEEMLSHKSMIELAPEAPVDWVKRLKEAEEKRNRKEKIAEKKPDPYMSFDLFKKKNKKRR